MKISVVIPALHEQAAINRTIGRLRDLGSEALAEILVVDGAPEMDTLAALTDTGVKGMASEKGRARQMNRGAAGAGGDVLLFLHADTELPADAFSKIASVMDGTSFVAGAFDLRIGCDGFAFRLIERVASVRSRLTRIPYGDQAVFIRRDYFLGIGGYREMPLMEDVELMRRIKKRGDRICILHERVKASGRRWEKEGVVRCTLRNWGIMLLYLAGVSPERLVRWYPSP